jgi:hypothetical protein
MAINLVLKAEESPFLPDSATTNAATMQMATKKLNPSPPNAAVAADNKFCFLDGCNFCHCQQQQFVVINFFQKMSFCACQSGFGLSWC